MVSEERPNIEELLKSIECDQLETLKKYYPGLEFRQELEEFPKAAPYLKQQIENKAMQVTDPLLNSDAPKLNEDYSNYFVINNMPICKEEAKVEKLKALVVKGLKKSELSVEEDKINVPFDPETNQTFGTAFVEMANEEQARLGARCFDNYALTKKNIFATCLFSEFESIMQTEEEFKMPQSAANLRDLRAPVFDIKKDQYVFKTNKTIKVNSFDRQMAQNNQADETIVTIENVNERTQWSPQGTYLIVIKPDQIDFLGGESMIPIITLPQSKVSHVSMSPCESYVLTLTYSGEPTCSVWNFKMVEIIRQLPLVRGEDEETYKWSYDGKFVAKRFKQDITKDDGTIKTKEGVSVYSLPSMEMITNADGQKKSITIPGIKDWMWAPARQMLIYSCFFGSELEEEDRPEGQERPQDPRIGFMAIPSRQIVENTIFKDSMELTMRMHPLGKYLGVINKYRAKKGNIQYLVELFDLQKTDTVPHQQVIIKRQIIDFTDIYWDQAKDNIAVHTLSKKDSQLTVDAKRHGVDIYRMTQDKLKGFQVETIGAHPSEKVQNFSWSPAGDILAIQEKDLKVSWNFYMLVRGEDEKPVEEAIKPIVRGKGGKQAELKNINMLAATEARWEFKKTARQDVADPYTEGCWDHFGRFFVVQGVKPPGPWDKVPRSMKFYNMFGEPLQALDKIEQLSNFMWRPRMTNILEKKAYKTLQKDYRKLYGKEYRDEERAERLVVQEEIAAKKKTIRDEFLSKFFIPMRRKYEADIGKYQEMWPLKEADIADEPVTVQHVYQYQDIIETKKVNF